MLLLFAKWNEWKKKEQRETTRCCRQSFRFRLNDSRPERKIRRSDVILFAHVHCARVVHIIRLGPLGQVLLPARVTSYCDVESYSSPRVLKLSIWRCKKKIIWNNQSVWKQERITSVCDRVNVTMPNGTRDKLASRKTRIFYWWYRKKKTPRPQRRNKLFLPTRAFLYTYATQNMSYNE